MNVCNSHILPVIDGYEVIIWAFFHAAESRHYVTDLHATVLHLLGLDHRKMEIPGRKRLDLDFGSPIKEILA
jgi:hypothetical protein